MIIKFEFAKPKIKSFRNPAKEAYALGLSDISTRVWEKSKQRHPGRYGKEASKMYGRIMNLIISEYKE